MPAKEWWQLGIGTPTPTRKPLSVAKPAPFAPYASPTSTPYDPDEDEDDDDYDPSHYDDDGVWVGPTCDYCGGEAPHGKDDDWNTTTKNHISCEYANAIEKGLEDL
jgi:hypothetical protein